MSIKLNDLQGCPLDQQSFTMRDMVQAPISKLDDDTFTRVGIVLMNVLAHCPRCWRPCWPPNLSTRLRGNC